MTEPCLNTDREIWREREGDFYADSIHVTQDGRIGINCGGFVIVLPVRSWHALASNQVERHVPTERAQAAADEHSRPCVLFRPALSIDGNKWCALYGANLQDGVAGFGDSPAEAMYDFDKNWNQTLLLKEKP